MPLTVWVHTLFPPHVFNPLSPSSFVQPSLQPHCLNKKGLHREWSSSFLQTHFSWIVFKSLSECRGTSRRVEYLCCSLNSFMLTASFLIKSHELGICLQHLTGDSSKQMQICIHAFDRDKTYRNRVYGILMQKKKKHCAKPLVVQPIFIEDKVEWIIHHTIVARQISHTKTSRAHHWFSQFESSIKWPTGSLQPCCWLLEVVLHY